MYASLQLVTLTPLLTHTAGFPPTNFNWKEGSNPTLLDVLIGQSPALNASVQVRYTPGTRYEYYNLSHVVIQFLLEEIFHTSFPAIMAEKEISLSSFLPGVFALLRPARPPALMEER